MRCLRGLMQRGQDEGAFRSDLPAAWLVAALYTVSRCRWRPGWWAV
jgi:hypothetical protein